jgi:hypothetical protein
MALAPRSRMDPSPRSFAPDAHACIMVLVPMDQPNTSLRRDIASTASSPRKSSQCRQHQNAHPTLKPAAGLAIVKGYVASRWPAATLDPRSAHAASCLQVGTRRCRSPSNKEMTHMVYNHDP